MSVTPDPDVASDPPWRPTVDDVAALIRARTKDASMNETGTFNADTRPTDTEIERLITNGCAKLAARVGWDLPDEAWSEAGHLTALLAACEAELSYWPEQVHSNRSPYDQLWAMYQYDVGIFADYIAQIAPGGTLGATGGSIPTPSSTVVAAYRYGLGFPITDLTNLG